MGFKFDLLPGMEQVTDDTQFECDCNRISPAGVHDEL